MPSLAQFPTGHDIALPFYNTIVSYKPVLRGPGCALKCCGVCCYDACFQTHGRELLVAMLHFRFVPNPSAGVPIALGTQLLQYATVCPVC